MYLYIDWYLCVTNTNMLSIELSMKTFLKSILILSCLNICRSEIVYNKTENGIKVAVYNSAGELTLNGTIGVGINFTDVFCYDDFYQCVLDDKTNLTTAKTISGTIFVWTSQDPTFQFKDCYSLGPFKWFGGPQRYVQRPLEQQMINGSEPYVIKKTDNFAVAERYWLNSKGTFIFVDDRVPLFVDQNNEEPGVVCFSAKSENPYINRNRTILRYDLVIRDDAKDAHTLAVSRYLGKPRGHPNERMIRRPIWTTWPKYKKNIDENIVKEFTQSIADHNFTGQIEIDEDWEVCFGSHVFNKDKFPTISSTVQFIKSLGFNVTLWINPFVNNDCQNYSSEGLAKGYFVKDPEGNTRAIWWESDDAHQVDFTNPDAAEWFASEVRALVTDPGMDGFKFDAGETDYAIPPAQFDLIEDQEQVPNIFTTKYVETCSQFGDAIEVRSAWRTQNYPFFLRMIDKDSVWGDDDGLYTLVTTLLQLNMNGYTMILPDMVGGNGYKQQPTAELIVRWTQANALMPSLQFGYLPWDYPSESFDTVAIVRKFVDLHAQYADVILKAMQQSVSFGTPVNGPIWWIDPTDPKAFEVDDEFLLGERILVAPVLVEGATTRKVYLPKGIWKDGNYGTIYSGPLTISEYKAPIDVLPYFIRIRIV